jgi:hypothetical protein
MNIKLEAYTPSQLDPTMLKYNRELKTLYVFSTFNLYRVRATLLEADIETVIIEPRNGNDFVDMVDSLPWIINLVSTKKIKVLRCLKVDLNQPRTGNIIHENISSLKSATFTSCANTGAVMTYLLVHCSLLQELEERGPKLSILNHSNSNREVFNITTSIRTMLAENYRLKKFHYDRLEARVVEFPTIPLPDGDYGAEMQEKFATLVNRQKGIFGFLERNRRGYDKCRRAVYQLLLIKRFASENPFRLLNRDVMLMIAKMVYATIGTKVWCQSAQI